MPNNPSTNRAARPVTQLEPVPVGLFLAARSGPRPAGFARPGLPDWHGLSPADLAYLIRRYTRAGAVVLDLDEHPTVAAAARYLRRAPATLVTRGRTTRLQVVAPPARVDRPRRVASRPGPGADLIMVTLPRVGVDSLDLHGLTRAVTGWRRLLRPGGHLIAALTARVPEPGPEPGTVGHRSTVIAAARAAGLVYHQHIPVLLIPLPEHDPRTDPNPANEPDRPHHGRHRPAFRDLLAFAGTTSTTEEATRG
ncbi:hypothetical protein [Phytohabitans houttuyneae]